MAEHSQPTYRAILVPHHKITPEYVDVTDSSYTQSGPLPGKPVAQADTDMTLESSGSQSAAATLVVRAERGGHPGRDSGKAGFVWKQTADASWRGHDVPQPLVALEALSYHNLATVRNERGNRYPHGVVLADGTVVVANCNNDGATSYVSIFRRAPSTGAWTLVGNIVSEPCNGTDELHPCLLLLPSGRILLFRWTFDTVNDEGQVRMHYSTDDGVTWAVGSYYVLPVPIDMATYTITGTRCAYGLTGIVLLVTLGGTNEIRQYASDSLGAMFVLVETTATGASVVANSDVCALPDGAGFIASDRTNTIATSTRAVVFASAFQPASTGTSIVMVGSFSGAQGIQFCVDDNGTVYAYGLNTTFGWMGVARSLDAGANFESLGDYYSAPVAVATGNGGEYPDRYHVVFQRGRTLLLHNFESTGGGLGGDYDNSLMCSYHGGYSDFTMPPQSRYDTASRRGHWLYDWVPYNLPGDMLWTAAGVAAVETLVSLSEAPHLNLHTAAGNARTYTRNAGAAGSPTVAEGIGATCTVSCQDSTGTVAAMRLNIDDTADDFAVEIRLSTTALVLWDVNGAAQIASVAVSSNTWYQVQVWLDSTDGITGRVHARYRAWSANEDRQWTTLGSSLAVARAPGGALTYACIFGHITAGAAESQWNQVSFVSGDEVGVGLAVGQTNPDDLALRQLSMLPTYIDDGVLVKAVDGPAFRGDTWNIATRYRYPIENIYPHLAPSPQDVWRSTGTGAVQQIAWAFHAQAGQGEDWGSDLLGIYVEGNNATLVIQTEATPGAGWVTRATLDLTTACSYTRAGESVELVYLGTPLRLEADELVGCTVMLDPPVNPTVYRKIAHNTGGVLQASGAGTYRRPRLYCEDLVVGDDAAGTAYLFHRRALAILQLAGIAFSGLRIWIGDNGYPPADGYFEGATVMIGPVYVLGWDPSQTRSRIWKSNVALREDRAGRRRATVRGPRREQIEIAWVEGVDQTALYDGAADYLLASDVASAEPVAMRADTPMSLSGLHRYLDGPGELAVYIPRLPHLTAAATAFARHQAGGARLVRIVSDLDMQTLIGEEEDTEVVRCSLTLDEEV